MPDWFTVTIHDLRVTAVSTDRAVSANREGRIA
jgi:hypothetical protein